MKKLSVIFVLAFSLVFLNYCGKKEEKKAQPVQEKKVEKVEKKVEKKVFAYTDNPTLDMIPSEPLKGRVVKGDVKTGFIVESIMITPGFKSWQLCFADKKIQKVDEDFDFTDAIKLKVELTKQEIKSGDIIENTADIEKEQDLSFIELYLKKGETYEPISSYTRVAYVVKFTKWEIEPYKKETGSGNQLAGKASGMVAVCIKGDGSDFDKVWIAGQFEDVPVYYTGKPPWIKD